MKMTDESQTGKTPLIDLLANVPEDAQAWHGNHHIPYGRLCKEANDTLEQAQAEVDRLSKQVYLDGHWSCPKCKFYLVSTSFYAGDGSMAPNTEPQKCANGCGPMWKVTHEQSANMMVDRCEKQTTRIEQLEAENEQVRKDLMDAIDQIPDTTP